MSRLHVLTQSGLVVSFVALSFMFMSLYETQCVPRKIERYSCGCVQGSTGKYQDITYDTDKGEMITRCYYPAVPEELCNRTLCDDGVVIGIPVTCISMWGTYHLSFSNQVMIMVRCMSLLVFVACAGWMYTYLSGRFVPVAVASLAVALLPTLPMILLLLVASVCTAREDGKEDNKE